MDTRLLLSMWRLILRSLRRRVRLLSRFQRKALEIYYRSWKVIDEIRSMITGSVVLMIVGTI
jgi:hypothetical protein